MSRYEIGRPAWVYHAPSARWLVATIMTKDGSQIGVRITSEPYTDASYWVHASMSEIKLFGTGENPYMHLLHMLCYRM